MNDEIVVTRVLDINEPMQLIGEFKAPIKSFLTFTSPRFIPNELDLGPINSFDDLQESFKRLMPDDVQKVAASRSPQQPLVMLTHQSYGSACLANNFLFYTGQNDGGLALYFEEGYNLGSAISTHIEEGWLSDVDANGRPLDWDEEFVPSNVVVVFKALSAQHAYLKVLTSLSDFIFYDGEESITYVFEREEPFEDMDEDEEVQFNNRQHIDIETPMLFLHLTGSNKLTWTLVKMRDVLADAVEFCGHNLGTKILRQINQKT